MFTAMVQYLALSLHKTLRSVNGRPVLFKCCPVQPTFDYAKSLLPFEIIHVIGNNGSTKHIFFSCCWLLATKHFIIRSRKYDLYTFLGVHSWFGECWWLGPSLCMEVWRGLSASQQDLWIWVSAHINIFVLKWNYLEVTVQDMKRN